MKNIIIYIVNFFKKIFNLGTQHETEDTMLEENIDRVLNFVEELKETQLYEEISQEIKDYLQNNDNPTKEVIFSFIEKIPLAIDALQLQEEFNLNLLNFDAQVSEMSNLSEPEQHMDHEYFSDSKIMETVVECEKYLDEISDIEQTADLSEQTKQTTAEIKAKALVLDEQLQAVTEKFTTFKQSEAVLREEIEAFAISVKSIQNKGSNTPDFNAKKAAYDNKSKQLQSRREEYINQEKALNVELESIAVGVYSLYIEFEELVSIVGEEIKAKISDKDINQEKEILQMTYKNVKGLLE